jgi:hypothetical protein
VESSTTFLNWKGPGVLSEVRLRFDRERESRGEVQFPEPRAHVVAPPSGDLDVAAAARAHFNEGPPVEGLRP